MPFFESLISKLFYLPSVSVNLMLEKTEANDPFYAEVVKRFYATATSPHPKLFFIKQYQFGYALCRLPVSFDDYFHTLKKSARWNFRKATREGYDVKRFEVNSHLEEIADIWRSATVRQGKMPERIREGRVSAVNDPPSRSPFHDYFYIGAFVDGKLRGYASVAVLGELCNLNDLYGHVEFEQDGVVPLLLIKIAELMYASYPSVKYYAYGTYFGARAPMRRFKRKFQFYPYHVDWVLETPQRSSKSKQVYRLDMFREAPRGPRVEGTFIKADRVSDLRTVIPLWWANGPWWETVRSSLRIMTGKRIFYGWAEGSKLLHTGWANLGFCRHYPIESDSVVLGRVFTEPEYRNKGLASGALRRIMNILFRRGYRRFYIDNNHGNLASEKMIEKAGFTQRID